MSLLGLLGRGFGGLESESDPTLSAVDNGNDTGITATVGNTEGELVVVMGARWDGTLVGADFEELGSRVGDGNLVLDVDAGYWWLYARSLRGVSTVIGQRATTAEEAVFFQILDATTAKLQAMSFDGLTAAEIECQKFPLNPKDVKKQGIKVSPTRETWFGVVNLRNDHGYGVQLSYFAATNRDNEIYLGRGLLWRQTLDRAFACAGANIPGVDEINDIRIEPGPIFDPTSFAENWDAGAITLRVITREPRGI